MEMLTCDICGGRLYMDAGGQTATCEYCTMKYSVKRIKEKVQEIKGSVSIVGEVQAKQTGTDSDVKQWKILLDKYMRAMDYKAALLIAQKILEAVPSDEEVSKLYDELRVLQYFDIRDGVLVAYEGCSENIIIPEGVKKIKHDVFRHTVCKKIQLPSSLLELYSIPEGLEELIVPQNTKKLYGHIPWGLKKICLPINIEFDPSCFTSCNKLEEIDASQNILNKIISKVPGYYDCGLKESPWYKGLINRRKASGLCLHCGSTFKGLVKKTCLKCGKIKDY